MNIPDPTKSVLEGLFAPDEPVLIVFQWVFLIFVIELHILILHSGGTSYFVFFYVYPMISTSEKLWTVLVLSKAIQTSWIEDISQQGKIILPDSIRWQNELGRKVKSQIVLLQKLFCEQSHKNWKIPSQGFTS